MNKLTNNQISALKVISAGNNPTSAKSTLNSLARLGLIKVYPPLGWGITHSGMAALKELTDGQ